LSLDKASTHSSSNIFTGNRVIILSNGISIGSIPGSLSSRCGISLSDVLCFGLSLTGSPGSLLIRYRLSIGGLSGSLESLGIPSILSSNDTIPLGGGSSTSGGIAITSRDTGISIVGRAITLITSEAIARIASLEATVSRTTESGASETRTTP
jgi:hypothetical protein